MHCVRGEGEWRSEDVKMCHWGGTRWRRWRNYSWSDAFSSVVGATPTGQKELTLHFREFHDDVMITSSALLFITIAFR